MSQDKSLLKYTRDLLESTKEIDETWQEDLAKIARDALESGTAKHTINKAKKTAREKIPEVGSELTQAAIDKTKEFIKKKLGIKKESVMPEYDNAEEILEKATETPTMDTKTEEDPKLYQDAEGGHAKIDTDEGPDNSKKNMASIAGKGGGAKKIQTPKGNANVKEHLEALFDGEELSETFQSKASTIFEAAINERISQIEEDLTQQYQDILTENIEEVGKELAEKLDDYLGYVVEQWMEDNQLAVENGIRADVAENFIAGLKVLFENSYIDIPNEKYDLLDEITEVKDELEGDLNKALQENIELRKSIVALRCGEIFAEEADGLTDVEVEKLASLSEGIEFDTEEQYRDKIEVLRESYFSETPVLTEEVETTDQVISEGGPMDRYTTAIGRHSNYNKVS